MTIEYGWDRHVQSWCVMVLDDEHYEVESSYVGNKVSRDWQIEYFKEKYNIDEVIKIKAY